MMNEKTERNEKKELKEMELEFVAGGFGITIKPAEEYKVIVIPQ